MFTEVVLTKRDYWTASKWAASVIWDSLERDLQNAHGLGDKLGADETLQGYIGEVLVHKHVGVPIDTTKVGRFGKADIEIAGEEFGIRTTFGNNWTFGKSDAEGPYYIVRRVEGLVFELGLIEVNEETMNRWAKWTDYGKKNRPYCWALSRGSAQALAEEYDHVPGD